MKVGNKHIKHAILLVFTAFILSGCGLGKQEMPQESGISISKKGVITQVIVEGFAESYYNADELKSEIESQVALVSESGEAGYGGSVYVGGSPSTPVSSVATVGSSSTVGTGVGTPDATAQSNTGNVADTTHLGAGAMVGGGYNPAGSSSPAGNVTADTTDSADTVTNDNGDFVINGAGAGAFSGSGSFSSCAGAGSTQIADVQDEAALDGSDVQDTSEIQDTTTQSVATSIAPTVTQPTGQQVLFPQRKLMEEKKKKKEGELPIRLTDYELSETKTLRVELEFDDSNYYSSFNNRGLFVGHIQEAIDTGYAFPAVYATDGSGQASVDAMASEKKRTIVIFEEAQEIVTPKNIAYRSENVTVTDQVHAKIASDGDVGIVIY